MTRFLLAMGAMALALPAHAAPAPADGNQTTTFPFPAKAPVVVCLNGYDKARAHLNTMLKAAVPDDAANIAKLFDSKLNKFLDGRKLTAVRKDARAFLVVNDLEGIVQGKIPVSVLVPITSYKEFHDTFLTKDELKSYEKGRDGVDSVKTSATGDEATLYLVDLKEYLAVSTEKEVADFYAAKYKAGTTEPMGAAAAEAFLKADLAVYVNMDAINDQFGDQIRQFKGLIDFGLMQAQQQGVLPGLNKKQLEALKVAIKGLFQGLEDSRALVVSAEFRPDGLLVRIQARFAENTPSAKFIQSEASTALKEIGTLPKGMSAYSEAKLGDTLASFMRELSQEFSVAEDDEKGAAKLEEALKERAAAGPGGEWTATRPPGVSIVVGKYKEPAKAVEAIVKEYRAVGAGGKVNSIALKSAPKIEEKAQQYRDLTFTAIRLHYDFEATVAALPEAEREVALEALKHANTEKTELFIGTDGKQVIQVTGKDWAAARATLDLYLDGKESVAKDPAFAATRAALPADALQITIGETSATITTLMEGARSALQQLPMAGLPQIGPVKPVKGEPTYMGVAFAMKGDVISITAFVPTGSMAVMRKMLDGLFKNFE